MEIKARIKVNSGSRSIVKLGFMFKATLILFLVTGCITFGVSAAKSSLLACVLLVSLGLFFFYVFFKMLDAAFFSEEIILGESEIKYLKKTITGYDEKTFLFSEIKSLGFAGYQAYTAHPMDNPTIDFTGLGAGERELQYVIDAGTLEIVTDAGAFRFGKNLPSWEAEEVIAKLQEITGNRFLRKDQVPPIDEPPFENEEGGETDEVKA